VQGHISEPKHPKPHAGVGGGKGLATVESLVNAKDHQFWDDRPVDGGATLVMCGTGQHLEEGTQSD